MRIEDEYGEVNYKLGNVEIADMNHLTEYFSIPVIRNSLSTAFQSMKEGRDQLLHLLTIEEEDDEQD